MSRRILSYCRITNKNVLVDGKLILSNNENNINHWISDIYNYIKLSYPKYHKMDHLCKAGILAAEMVMEKLGLNNDELKTDWAICCMNRSGSLDNDTSYQKTIQNNDDFYPAPSLFVYTLSNIVLGEIAIKYKLRCESSCYVCEKFSSENSKKQEGSYKKFFTIPALDRRSGSIFPATQLEIVLNLLARADTLVG